MERNATEDEVHIAVADRLRESAATNVFWFHPPNGGYRSKSTAAKFKAMGTRPGVPDLIIIANGKVIGLELKRSRGGIVSPEQKVAHAEMEAAGATVMVARGYLDAIQKLQSMGIINH